MFLLWRVLIVMLVGGIAGCDAPNEQLPPLPALESPIPGPPEPYDPDIVSCDLKTYNVDQREITQAKVLDTIDVELNFQLGKDEPGVQSVLFRIGKERRDGFLIFNETAAEVKFDDNGVCHVKTQLKCPPVGGDFNIRAQINDFVLIDEPFKVLKE